MIRPATEADCEKVYKFFSHPEFDKHILSPPKSLEDFKLQYLKKLERTLYFLYEENNEPVGLAGYLRYSGRQKHVARIGPVLVMPGKTGQGVGTQLMAEILKTARKQGVIRLETPLHSDDDGLMDFYKKNGYEIESIKRKAYRKDGEYVDIYLMTKILENES